jgi:hypothetical protein
MGQRVYGSTSLRVDELSVDELSVDELLVDEITPYKIFEASFSDENVAQICANFERMSASVKKLWYAYVNYVGLPNRIFSYQNSQFL